MLDVVRLVRNMVVHGSALCVPGNHDVKLVKKLLGKNVQITHGLAETLAEIEAIPGEVARRLRGKSSNSSTAWSATTSWMAAAWSSPTPDCARRCKAEAQARSATSPSTARRPARPTSSGSRSATTGPRSIEAASASRLRTYAGPRSRVAQSHGQHRYRLRLRRQADRTPLSRGELVSVPAARTYCEPTRPFLAAEDQAPALSAQQSQDQVLDAEDVLGKRIIGTRLRGQVTIREENAVAALEVMSRFAVDPKWLIYLPPTMSPCETSREPGLLEHPAEAFAYYRSQGTPQVICEEKHMGSRAILVLCRDETAARERFGVTTGELGVVTTRTGRRFFNDPDLERRFLDRVRATFDATDLWGRFDTTWACLDCELMPWSAKAQELLRPSTPPSAPRASAALPPTVAALEQAASRLDGVERASSRRSKLPSASAVRTSAGSSPPIGSIAGRWIRSPA